MREFVMACAGKPFIKPEGVDIVIDSSKVSEAEFNAFCSKAIYMEVCIVISDSSWRSIRCPYLRELRPCKIGTAEGSIASKFSREFLERPSFLGKPVFTIVDNMQLAIIDIPLTVEFDPTTIAFVIRGNPLLPSKWLTEMRRRCPRCSIEEATGLPLDPLGRSISTANEPSAAFRMWPHTDGVHRQRARAGLCRKDRYTPSSRLLPDHQFE